MGGFSLVGLAMILFGIAAVRAAAQPVSREYDLKAAFVYNFATFVEWPNGAFARPDAPLVIGIIGDNPFGSALVEMTRGERIRGRPIVIRQVYTKEGAIGCDMVFISISARSQAREIIRFFHRRPVLMVADFSGFLNDGGMVLLGVDAHIRVQINLAAVRSAGLTISPKLLRLAEVVHLSDPAP